MVHNCSFLSQYYRFMMFTQMTNYNSPNAGLLIASVGLHRNRLWFGLCLSVCVCLCFFFCCFFFTAVLTKYIIQTILWLSWLQLATTERYEGSLKWRLNLSVLDTLMALITAVNFKADQTKIYNKNRWTGLTKKRERSWYKMTTFRNLSVGASAICRPCREPPGRNVNKGGGGGGVKPWGCRHWDVIFVHVINAAFLTTRRNVMVVNY